MSVLLDMSVLIPNLGEVCMGMTLLLIASSSAERRQRAKWRRERFNAEEGGMEVGREGR